MADILPVVFFPNMSADAIGLTIPYTDLPGLTQAEADVASGDAREMARVFMETFASAINNLAPENRPIKMTVTKANPLGIGPDEIRQSYTFQFDLTFSQSTVGLVGES